MHRLRRRRTTEEKGLDHAGAVGADVGISLIAHDRQWRPLAPRSAERPSRRVWVLASSPGHHELWPRLRPDFPRAFPRCRETSCSQLTAESASCRLP